MSDTRPADSGPPLLHLQEGRATLTLNRPAHHNRLHEEDLLALQAHFKALEANADIKVLILTAAGRSFCSGFNLQQLRSREAATPPSTPEPRLFEQTVDALEALNLPSICRFNGSVFGGAIDLGLACDFRIGVQGMRARMPAARLGLHYYANGLGRYVSRLGLNAAKRLFLLAEELSADDLLQLGYLDQAVAEHQLDAAVAHIADALCAGAPLALRGMKHSLNEIARGAANAAAMHRREQVCAASADLREGLAAAAQRRPARFQGR